MTPKFIGICGVSPEGLNYQTSCILDLAELLQGLIKQSFRLSLSISVQCNLRHPLSGHFHFPWGFTFPYWYLFEWHLHGSFCPGSLQCNRRDGIPPSILKFSAAALLEPAHHLFSLCLLQSYLPAESRRHYITPIHKSGDRSQVSNYGPLSLLCCLTKVLERIVFNSVRDFLTTISISISQCLRPASMVGQKVWV